MTARLYTRGLPESAYAHRSRASRGPLAAWARTRRDSTSYGGGANDIFLNQALSQPQNPVASVANLAAAITDLYNLGARTLLVPNLPDVGRSPAFVGQPGAAGATALTLAFNALLAGAILNLEGTLGGLDILPFDTFALFDEVLSDLGAFGLTRQRRAICSDRRATRRGSFSGTSSIRPPPGIRYSASASSRRSSRSPTPSR